MYQGRLQAYDGAGMRDSIYAVGWSSTGAVGDINPSVKPR